MSARDFFDRTVLSTNPELGLSFDELWKLVCGESRVLHPESFEILAELKESRQFRLATLNNESRELNDYRLETFGLRQYFDYFICSGYVHEMKPLAEIYRVAIDISGFAPESALFIDDKQENCDTASAMGMKAIRFDSPAQLRAALAECGVAVQV
jgi:putative hydrolase of the HAD superfamily